MVCRSVGLSVYLSVTVVSPAKTAEPIEMPFGLYGLGWAQKAGVRWSPDRHAKGQFFGERTCTGMPDDTLQ